MSGLTICLLTLLTISCKKSSYIEKSLSEKDKELITLYSKVGEIHNKGMDFVYKQVKQIVDTRKSKTMANRSADVSEDIEITLKQLNEIVFQFVKDSLQANGIDFIPFYSKDTLLKYRGFSDEPLATHYYKLTGDVLSQKLIEALNDFELIFRNDEINTISSSYEGLFEKWVPELESEIDKAAFIGAVSVGKNSLLYWTSEKDKWDELEYEMTGQVSAKAAKDVAYADCAGAITGAIGGAYVGLTGGTVVIPVIGTAVGGACGVLVGTIGGAIGGSATEAIHSVIKWLINW